MPNAISRRAFLKNSALGAAALAAPSALRAAAGPSAAPPNIVIILADDLGYGDVKCFNPQSKIATPNLDRLAAEGMRFTDAHAPASICVPSRYGLLTGRYPFRTWSAKGKKTQRRNDKEAPHYDPPMLLHDPKRLNLATLMRRNGYATAAFGKWHQGMRLSAAADGTLAITPVDFGFDYYFGIDAPEQGPYAFIENKRFVEPPTRRIPEQMGEKVTNTKTQGAHWAAGDAAPDWDFRNCLPTIASKAEAWIRAHAGASNKRPFFLYYALPAPHAPWMALAANKGQSGAGQYGDYVMTVDAMIGQLLVPLTQQGLNKNTLVIFSSDNGPVWYPQDIARYGHRAAAHWHGMKGDLHEGGHRMPFIARWPGRVKAGSTCDALICFTDLMATFAELAGDSLPGNSGEDSFDLSPLLLGKKPPRPIRSGMIHPNWGSYTLAIRNGDWKLILPQRVYTVEDRTITPGRIVAAKGKHSPDIFELYNLKDDPAEAHNLAGTNPEKVEALFALLKEQIQKGVSR